MHAEDFNLTYLFLTINSSSRTVLSPPAPSVSACPSPLLSDPISKLAQTHLHQPSSCILNPIHQTDWWKQCSKAGLRHFSISCRCVIPTSLFWWNEQVIRPNAEPDTEFFSDFYVASSKTYNKLSAASSIKFKWIISKDSVRTSQW